MSVGQTFVCRDPYRCPQCDRESVVGILLVNDEGHHQHTWYVCTSWQGGRCGWTGWDVKPSPERLAANDEKEPESSSGREEATS